MHTIVLYDIPSSRIRLKVANACLDFGLDRTQYSVFEGELSAAHQARLMARVKPLLEGVAGFVVLLPISADDWARRMQVGETLLPNPLAEYEEIAGGSGPTEPSESYPF
ncbi:MAG: CRISPR-associated endonuclease Cas2 [Chloroflexi bacterium]|nr:MAG: CRISPR-associated endonuclease Cas2 [Chloroflexota bacterium]